LTPPQKQQIFAAGIKCRYICLGSFSSEVIWY